MLQTMTFKKKLLFAFLIMMVPLFLVGGLSIWTFLQVYSALQDLEPKYLQAFILGEIETAINRELKETSDYLTEGDPDAREELVQIHNLVSEKIGDWKTMVSTSKVQNLPPLEKIDFPVKEAKDVEDVESLYLQINKEIQEILSLYDHGEKEKAITLMEKILEQKTLKSFEAKIQDLIHASKQASLIALQTINRLEKDSQLILSMGIFCSLILGILFAIVISLSISRPVEELKKATEIFGEGHLDYRISLKSSDEIGILARSFDEMAKKLRDSQERLTQSNVYLQAKIKELEETQAQLIQSEKLASIGQMSAAVAHGMRNPLANIRAVTQISLRELSKERERASPTLEENLKDIISQVDRLEKRIGHLLDFTRPFPFNPFKENINTVLNHVLSTFRNTLVEKGVSLETHFQENLPDILLDSVQMEQSLSEIISNALDAMPAGGTLRILSQTIQCGSSKDHSGNTYIQVAFQDTGEGIPEDILPRVFDPFFTTKPDGNGLGLAFAYRVIERHKGHIQIESRLDQGTCIKIGLPVNRRMNDE
jgi:signal transduction histidine kinase